MSDLTAARTPDVPSHGVPFGEAMKVWARVAALSFGGPAGQIAVMHRIIVEEKKWIGENRFLQALNYCTLLPGPEAQQLAVYIGWLMHKTRGGLFAGTLFVLPGLLSIMALSWIYVLFGKLTIIEGLFGSVDHHLARSDLDPRRLTAQGRRDNVASTGAPTSAAPATAATPSSRQPPPWPPPPRTGMASMFAEVSVRHR